MPQAKAETKYRVLNPRSIGEGLPILTFEEKSEAGLVLQEIVLYEGETFIPPKHMDVTHLLGTGMIERA